LCLFQCVGVAVCFSLFLFVYFLLGCHNIGEPNPNSTGESSKITVVFEGKTLIFENFKPK
jgi:hypothetical protein